MVGLELRCPNCGANVDHIESIDYKVFKVEPRSLSRSTSGYRVSVDILTEKEMFKCTKCLYDGSAITFESGFQEETGQTSGNVGIDGSF
jgi:hypothetical protein